MIPHARGMTSTTAKARLAGALYVVMSIPAWYSLMYVPSVIVVRGDADATARNIATYQFIYRLGILGELVSQIGFVFLVLVLYDLFKDVDRKYARLMVTLVAISVAFEFANCLNLVAPLILLGGGGSLAAFTTSQLDALALVFLRLRNSGLGIISLIWGLWLLPFGLLVYKSGFFPKALGVMLVISCIAYITDGVAITMSRTPMHAVSTASLAIGGLGELSIVAWMLFFGTKTPALEGHPA
jgi:hypothetical protein